MQERYDVLVELDALMDTRLGSLAGISEEAVTKTVTNPLYFTRMTDDFESFCGLTKEVTDAAYKARSVDTLKMSIMTPMVLQVAEIIKSIRYDGLGDKNVEPPELAVNYFPYLLDEDERDAMASVITMYMPPGTVVRMTSMPPETVTPEFIKNTLSGMVLYNFNEWVIHHEKGFRQFPAPRVTIVAPMRYVDKEPPPEMARIKDLDNATPFSAAKYAYSLFFTLSYLPINRFCIVRPDQPVA